MPRLSQSLVDRLTTQEVVVDSTEEGDVTVKIRAVPAQTLLQVFKDSKGLKKIADKRGDDELTEDDLDSLLESDLNLDMITKIVTRVMVEPKVVESDPKDDEVTIDQISKYHLTIFNAAMSMSGYGGDAKSFRGNKSGTPSSDGGKGVRKASDGNSGPQLEQPPVGTTV